MKFIEILFLFVVFQIVLSVPDLTKPSHATQFPIPIIPTKWALEYNLGTADTADQLPEVVFECLSDNTQSFSFQLSATGTSAGVHTYSNIPQVNGLSGQSWFQAGTLVPAGSILQDTYTYRMYIEFDSLVGAGVTLSKTNDLFIKVDGTAPLTPTVEVSHDNSHNPYYLIKNSEATFTLIFNEPIAAAEVTLRNGVDPAESACVITIPPTMPTKVSAYAATISSATPNILYLDIKATDMAGNVFSMTPSDYISAINIDTDLPNPITTLSSNNLAAVFAKEHDTLTATITLGAGDSAYFYDLKIGGLPVACTSSGLMNVCHASRTVVAGETLPNVVVSGFARDEAGNEVTIGYTSSIDIDTSVPYVGTSTVISNDCSSSLCGIGNTIEVKIKWTELVTIESGSPALVFNTGGGGFEETSVSFLASPSTDEWTFTYVVEEGHQSPLLDVSQIKNVVAKDSANNECNYLISNGIVAANLRVNGVRLKVQSVAATISNQTVKTGSVVTIHLTFSATVVVGGVKPTLKLQGVISPVACNGLVNSGGTNNVLVCTYTVTANEEMAVLEYEDENTSFVVNSLADTYGNSVDPVLPSVGSGASLSNSNIAVDAVAPTIAFISSPSTSRTYLFGEDIDIRVTMTEPVVLVGGTPVALTLTLTSGGTTDTADCSLFSSTVLQCIYTVLLNQKSTSDLSVSSVSGGVKDIADNPSNLSSIPPASNLHHSSHILVDGEAPVVLRVEYDSLAAGTYTCDTGRACTPPLIVINVVVSTPVENISTMELKLNTGVSVVDTNTMACSATISFSYDWNAQDAEVNGLDYLDENSLIGNFQTCGGTPVNMHNSLPTPGGGDSLQTVLVNLQNAPTIKEVTTTPNVDTFYNYNDVVIFDVEFYEPVVVTGSPWIDLNGFVGVAGKGLYHSTIGNIIRFHYTVGVNDKSTAGIGVTGSINPAGSVKDDHGRVPPDMILPASVLPLITCDGTLPSVQFESTTIYGIEDNVVMVKVKLSVPIGSDALFRVTYSSGTATLGAGNDLIIETPAPATHFVIPADSTDMSFQVDVLADNFYEDDENWVMQLEVDSGSNCRLGSESTLNFIVVDQFSNISVKRTGGQPDFSGVLHDDFSIKFSLTALSSNTQLIFEPLINGAAGSTDPYSARVLELSLFAATTHNLDLTAISSVASSANVITVSPAQDLVHGTSYNMFIRVVEGGVERDYPSVGFVFDSQFSVSTKIECSNINPVTNNRSDMCGSGQQLEISLESDEEFQCSTCQIGVHSLVCSSFSDSHKLTKNVNDFSDGVETTLRLQLVCIDNALNTFSSDLTGVAGWPILDRKAPIFVDSAFSYTNSASFPQAGSEDSIELQFDFNEELSYFKLHTQVNGWNGNYESFDISTSYTFVIAGADITGDGTLTVDYQAIDVNNNVLTTSLNSITTDNGGNSIEVDVSPPVLQSFEPKDSISRHVGDGETVQFQMKFDEEVMVEAATTLEVPVLVGSTPLSTNCVSVGNAYSIYVVVECTVGPSDVGSLNLSSSQSYVGVIHNKSGLPAERSLDAISNLSYNIDGVHPYVLEVSGTGSGSYNTGTIDIEVRFSENIYVTTSATMPELLLSDGLSATFSGTSGSVMTFSHAITAGNDSPLLKLRNVNSLVLNGRTITDSTTEVNTADIVLPVPTEHLSLSDMTTIVIDTTAPEVSSIVVLSPPGTYYLGQSISIGVTFSEACNFAATTFQLLVEYNTGSYRAATYMGEQSDTMILFQYVVSVGDQMNPFDYKDSSALSITAGSVSDMTGNALDTTLPNPGTSSLSVGAISIDGIVPIVNSIAITAGDTGQNKKLSDTIDIEVIFSEPILIQNGSGHLVLSLNTGQSVPVFATSTSHVTDTVMLRYSVVDGDFISALKVTDLDALKPDTGVTVTDIAGNSCDLTLPTDLLDPALDGIRPYIVDVTAVEPSKLLKATDVINIAVVFNEDITVDNVPQLQLDVGLVTPRTLSYASMTGSRTMLFPYDVRLGEETVLLELETARLSQNSLGRIKDGFLNEFAFLGAGVDNMPTLGSDSSLSNNRKFIVDGVAPVVEYVESSADGNFKIGDTLEILVEFSEEIVVTGVPAIELDYNGGVEALYSHLSVGDIVGKNTRAHFFYVIQEGDVQPDLNYLSTTISGTIHDIAGNPCNMILPSLAHANSLSGRSSVSIDGIRATIDLVNSISVTPVKIGSSFEVRVQFSEIVNVTPSSVGAHLPTLKLDCGKIVEATYLSGSGTNTLIFEHTVADGEYITVVDLFDIHSFLLNYATCTDQFGNDAVITLPQPGSVSSLSVLHPIFVDGIKPNVVQVFSEVPSAGLLIGSTMSIFVRFAEGVSYSVSGGGTPPQLNIDVGSVVPVDCVRVVSGTDLECIYTSIEGDNTNDLAYISVDALVMNSGALVDTAGNSCDPTLPLPGSSMSLSASASVTVDAIAPEIKSISAEASVLLGVDDSITLYVEFTEEVAVVGFPKLSMVVGSSAYAQYVTGSGSSILKFEYTVSLGHSSNNLASDTLVTSGGASIKDLYGNSYKTSSFPVPGSVSSLDALSNIVVDGITATVVSVKAEEDGLYKADSVINLNVEFSEPVSILGLPSLSLQTGVAFAAAMYKSGSGTSTLVFEYIVKSGDLSSDLDVLGTSALSGDIFDLAGNPVNLALASGDLASNSDVSVDGSAPYCVEIFSSDAINTVYAVGDIVQLIVRFNKIIRVTPSSSGNPYLMLETGSDDAKAEYVNGSGSDSIVFAFTVAEGMESSLLDSHSNKALVSNGSLFQDEHGNEASLVMPTGVETGSLTAQIITIDGLVPYPSRVYTGTPSKVMKYGSTLFIFVQFSEAVSKSGAGVPVLNTEFGSQALFIGMDTVDTAKFEYTAQATDKSLDLSLASSSALDMMGSSFTDNAGNIASTILPSPGSHGSLSSSASVVVDGVEPIVEQVRCNPLISENMIGSEVTIEVVFSENVIVSGGQPKLALDCGSVSALYDSGSLSKTLLFKYIVNEGDCVTSDMRYATTSSLSLELSSIKDTSGNSADLTLPAPGAENSLDDSSDCSVDAIKPSILSISGKSPDGAYKVGQTIVISVVFSEPMKVTGVPYLSLNSGDSASFTSKESTTELLFEWTVRSGDSVTALDVNELSGDLSDIMGNAADLTVATNMLSSSSTLLVDGISPHVVAVSCSTPGSVLNANEQSSIIVEFSEDIIIAIGNGSVRLSLAVSPVTSFDVLCSSSTSDAKELICLYSAQIGHSSTAIDVAGRSALSLTGSASITDLHGNVALLTLPVGSDSGSLAAEVLGVDGILPSVEDVYASVGSTTLKEGDSVDIIVEFSEDIIVSGSPKLALVLGAFGEFIDQPLPTQARFRYTTETNHYVGVLDTVGSDSLFLNGGQIVDSHSNAALLTLPVGRKTLAASNVAVDGVKPKMANIRSLPSTGSLKIGDQVRIFCEMSEPVTVSGSPKLMLETGNVDREAVVLLPVGVASEIEFNYVVEAGDYSSKLGFANFFMQSASAILDLAGNVLDPAFPDDFDGLDLVIDGIVPSVSSVRSDSADGTYHEGESIIVSVIFDEIVVVSGVPTIDVECNRVGAVAYYMSGSDSNTLLFKYDILVGDHEDNFDYNGVSALKGSIFDKIGNSADLTLVVNGDGDGELKQLSDISIDGISPTISWIDSDSASLVGESEIVNVSIHWSEEVVVSAAFDGSLPSLTLETGVTDIDAAYVEGSGTDTLVFRFSVPSGLSIPLLDVSGTGSLSSNGGNIIDSHSNDAIFTLPANGSPDSLGVRHPIQIDSERPWVSRVYTDTPSISLKTGQTLDIFVEFSENIEVSGSPELLLDIGYSASCDSKLDAKTLTCGFTVPSGVTTFDLGYHSTAALQNNGAVVKDIANNVADLSLVNPNTVGSLSSSSSIIIDAQSPSVISVDVITSSQLLQEGDKLSIQCTFTESVKVSGIPTITLETGSVDGKAIYVDGDSTSVLEFTYTVESGHTSLNLDYQGVNALMLDGGQITDTLGNNAVLLLPIPGSAGSLSDNSQDIIIDGISPTVTTVSSINSNGKLKIGDELVVSVLFDEIVETREIPTISLNTGSGVVRKVNYKSGTGSTTLLFSYTVLEGDSIASVDYDSSAALEGTITDLAGNVANLALPWTVTHGSLSSNKNISLDGIKPSIASIKSVSGIDLAAFGNSLTLTITMSETVEMVPSNDGSSPTLLLNTGGVATYKVGSGSTLQFVYLVEAGHIVDQLEVTEIFLNGASLIDGAGNDFDGILPVIGNAASLGQMTPVAVDGVQPTVLRVHTDSPSKMMKTGSTINIFVTLSEPVISFGGLPTISLNAGADAKAVYISGSGDSTLTFGYEAMVGHSSIDLDYVSASALNLLTAVVVDSAGNPLEPTLPSPGSGSSLGDSSSISVDTNSPSALSVTSSTVNSSSVLKENEIVTILITFNEVVFVVGTPFIALNVPSCNAVYKSGHGTSILAFEYTVLSGDEVSQLSTSSSISLPVGSLISDNVGNPIHSTLPVSGAGSLIENSSLRIDGISPTIGNVSAPTSTASYGIGMQFEIDVLFSEPVVVNEAAGNLQLILNTGSSASYSAGSGTDTLSFIYIVKESDLVAEVDYADSAALIGATLTDEAGNYSSRALYFVSGKGKLRENTTISVDGSIPKVTFVDAIGDSVLNVGKTFEVQIHVSKPILVTLGDSSPELNLIVKTGSVKSVGLSGVTNTALHFSYAVQENDEIDIVEVESLNLNGAVGVDSHNNVVDWSLPERCSSESLCVKSPLKIDGVLPKIERITTISSGLHKLGDTIVIGVEFSENVNVSGTSLALMMRLNDSLVVPAIYESGSGTSALSFKLIVEDHYASDEVNVDSTTSLLLNGDIVLDDAGNEVVLTVPISGLNSLKNFKAISVDGKAPFVTKLQSVNPDGNVGLNDEVVIVVEMSEPVYFPITATPLLTLETGAVDAEAYLISSSGISSLMFRFRVLETHISSSLDVASVNAISAFQCFDAAGNSCDLTVPIGVEVGSLQSSSTLIVDGHQTSILSVQSDADGLYKIGDIVNISIVFEETVNVFGSPILSLSNGQFAHYKDGSESVTLNFQYTVSGLPGEDALLLDYKDSDALILGSAKILNEALNPADLTLPAPGSTGSLSMANTIEIDSTHPTVFEVVSGATVDNVSKFLETVQVIVRFSEPVIVSGGLPQLSLVMKQDGSSRDATYESGSGSTDLVFSIEVGMFDHSDDLGYPSTSSLIVGTAKITDIAGNAGVLILPTPGSEKSLTASASIVIDGSPPLVSFAAENLSHVEPGGSLPIMLNVERTVDCIVNVTIVVEGTAVEGTDFLLNASTVQFEASETSASVLLSIIDDVEFESLETIILKLDTLSNASFGTITQTTIAIGDNDSRVSFLADSSSTSERNGEEKIDISLGVAQDFPCTIGLEYSGADITFGVDYTASLSINIPAGQMAASLSVQLTDNSVRAKDVSISIKMSSFLHCTAGIITEHILTVVDDDVAEIVIPVDAVSISELGSVANYPVSLSSKPLHDVVLTPSVKSGYCLKSDGVLAMDKLCNIDDDCVDVSGQCLINTTANITPTELIFTPLNWSTPQYLVISAADDDFKEYDQVAVITHHCKSDDPVYNEDSHCDGCIWPPTLSEHGVDVTISDDDEAAVDISAVSLDLLEGSETPVQIMLRSEPFGDVNITFVVTAQIELNPSVITFSRLNWNSPQIVLVHAIEDTVAEGLHDGTITLNVSSIDSNYDSRVPLLIGTQIAVPNISVSISDNDSAGLMIVDAVSLEEGTNSTFLVKLTSTPTDLVTLKCESESPESLYVASGDLVFSPVNWLVPQAVTVVSLQDDMVKGEETFKLKWSASSLDIWYNSDGFASVSIVVRDDDLPGVTSFRESLRVSEGGFTDSVEFTLMSRPTSPIILVFSSSDDQLDFDPTDIQINPDQWEEKFSLIVSGVTDSSVEGQHSDELRINIVSTDPVYNNLGVSPIPVTIEEHTVVAPPRLLEATFSSNGAIIEILFDSPTNLADQTGEFSCDIVLHDVSKLGSSSCVWSTSSLLSVSLSSTSTVVVGDFLTLRANAVKASSAGQLSSEGSITIRAPVNPVPISLDVVGSRLLGACDNLSLTGVILNGAGASLRDSVVRWEVASSCDVSGFKDVVSSNFGKNLNVDRAALSAGCDYTIKFFASSFLGISGDHTTEISVTSEALLDIHFDASVVNIARSKSLFLKAVVDLPDCGNAVETPVDLRWSQESGPSFDGTFFDDFQDSSVMLLPRRSLQSGSYVFKLMGTIDSVSSFASILVNVAETDIIATIGGSERVWAASEPLTLDASASMDPDGEMLSYAWSCTNLSSSTPCSRLDGTAIEFSSLSILILSQNLLVPGSYEFEVIVSAGSRNATAVQKISIVGGRPPAIELQSIPSTVLSSSPLVLNAEVQSDEEYTLQWEQVSGDLVLATEGVINGSLNDSIITINKNQLTPGGKYIFRLVASSILGESFASLEFSVAMPPTGGSFTVSPESGTTAATYKLEMSNWSSPEEDGLLTYAFWWEDNLRGVVYLAEESRSAWIETALFYGNVKLFGSVSTVFGETVVKSLEVPVDVPATTTAALTAVNDQVSQVIEPAILTRDSSVVSNACSIAAMTLRSDGLRDSVGLTCAMFGGLVCNGRGTCKSSPNECSSSLPGCSSVCICDSGWSGEACQRTIADQAAVDNSKITLIDSLLNDTSIETHEQMKQRLSAWFMVLSPPQEIPENKLSDIADALKGYVSSSSYSSDLSHKTIEVVSLLTESIKLYRDVVNVSGGRILVEDTLDTVVKTLVDVTLSVGTVVSTADESTEISATNFLMSVKNIELKKDVLSEQLELNSVNGTLVIPWGELLVDSIDDSYVGCVNYNETINVTAMMWLVNNHDIGDKLSAGPTVTWKARSSVCSDIPFKVLAKPSIVNLPLPFADLDALYPPVEIVEQVVVCAENSREDIVVKCPDSEAGDVTVLCTGEASSVTVTCPYYEMRRSCEMWDYAEGEWTDSNCVMNSQTETSTSCECTTQGDISVFLSKVLVPETQRVDPLDRFYIGIVVAGVCLAAVVVGITMFHRQDLITSFSSKSSSVKKLRKVSPVLASKDMFAISTLEPENEPAADFGVVSKGESELKEKLGSFWHYSWVLSRWLLCWSHSIEYSHVDRFAWFGTSLLIGLAVPTVFINSMDGFNNNSQGSASDILVASLLSYGIEIVACLILFSVFMIIHKYVLRAFIEKSDLFATMRYAPSSKHNRLLYLARLAWLFLLLVISSVAIYFVITFSLDNFADINWSWLLIVMMSFSMTVFTFVIAATIGGWKRSKFLLAQCNVVQKKWANHQKEEALSSQQAEERKEKLAAKQKEKLIAQMASFAETAEKESQFRRRLQLVSKRNRQEEINAELAFAKHGGTLKQSTLIDVMETMEEKQKELDAFHIALQKQRNFQEHEQQEQIQMFNEDHLSMLMRIDFIKRDAFITAQLLEMKLKQTKEEERVAREREVIRLREEHSSAIERVQTDAQLEIEQQKNTNQPQFLTAMLSANNAVLRLQSWFRSVKARKLKEGLLKRQEALSDLVKQCEQKVLMESSQASIQTVCNYALLLHCQQREYAAAGELYYRVLSGVRDNPVLLYAYAIFLQVICAQESEIETYLNVAQSIDPSASRFGMAEQAFFVQAVKSSPQDAQALLNLAVLNHTIRLDIEKAEMFYLLACKYYSLLFVWFCYLFVHELFFFCSLCRS
eukprot:TRINITY_DN3502_c0_g1_i1.p1 TRINITY_DN3502_c0_g1~~TRINITY_DN3502_c0_g1_i1.p1  ORF type:complete len:7696 (+),score=2092.46 TRINITY_DN3502_c0_g1_i1:80-23167(+)